MKNQAVIDQPTVIEQEEISWQGIKLELEKLVNQAGDKLWKRVQLCYKMLHSTNWVGDEMEGSESKAYDFLQARYMGDLCGAVGIHELFDLYEAFPDKNTWRIAKYNIRRLAKDLADQKRQAVQGGESGIEERRATVRWSGEKVQALCDERVHDHDQKLRTVHSKELASKDEIIMQLQERIRLLETEKARLEGRITELERRLG